MIDCDYMLHLHCWGFLLAAFVLTSLLIPYVMRLARWVGAVDVGGYRKTCRGEVPLLGGFGIAFPFVAVCLFLSVNQSLVSDREPRYFLALAAACGAMALWGAVDDVYHLRARSKLVGQLLIALFLVWNGHRIPQLSVPLLGTIELNALVGSVFTVVWLVALTNAFNLMDGVDGLAAGLGLVSALGFAALAAVMDNLFVVLLSLTLAGSLAAFLRYNVAPARIFMGDTGSMFLGFTLAGIGLLGAHRSQATLLVGAPVLILGIPIIETLISMGRRFLYGRPVFFGDNRHTHHRLGTRGFSPRETVVLLCGVGAVLSCAGVMNQVVSPGTTLAIVPYLLYGAVVLTIVGVTGYAISPRKLAGVFSRRGRNALLNALGSYGAQALSLNQGAQYLHDILHMFRRHAGLSRVEVVEDGGEAIAASGVVNEQEDAQPFESIHLNLQQRRGLNVRYQFDHLPTDGERDDVKGALARMFHCARLRFGAGSAAEKSNILGIGCNLTNYQKVLETIEAWRLGKSTRSRYVAVINPHSVMMSKRNRNVRRAMAGAALSLPDGVGMVWAANILGYSHQGRVTGPTLMLNLCDSGREYGLRHYFYGGAPGVAEELTRRLCDAFPGLEVVGRDSPPFRPLSAEEDAAAIARINEREPDVLWVGLGAPKQERWMADHVDSVQVPIMIGVGAAFDFHSGNIKWAPRWIRLLGMEWAYRLVRAPGRLWKRNLDSPLFLFHVLLQKLRPPAFRQMAGDGGDEGDFLNLPLDGVEDGHANVLIVGVGRRSELFLRELESLPEHTNRRRRVVGLLAHGTVERSPSSVNGHRVLGNVACLGSLLNSAEIAEVVVTESLAAESLQEIVDTCSSCNVRVTSWQLESRTLSAPTL